MSHSLSDVGSIPSHLAQKGLWATHHKNVQPSGVPGSQPPQNIITLPEKRDPSQEMMGIHFAGVGKVNVVKEPKVAITDPTDAIVRITSSTVCGSDLHLYHREFRGLNDQQILGHEAVGIVESVGPDVKNYKPGDRVVISSVLSCGGLCEFCAKGKTGLCNLTNASEHMQHIYGANTAGLFGYTGLLGFSDEATGEFKAYQGLQASHARVPLADVNLFNVSGSSLPDEELIKLSDIYCTAWHANETVGTGPEDEYVAIWGGGPIGLLCATMAKLRGAGSKGIVIIDSVPFRLETALKYAGATAVIDRSKEDVINRLQQLCPGGVHACIEASAMRYASGVVHKLSRAIGLETDTPQQVNECIVACRKAGKIGLIADYYGYCNHFAIGPLMEKSINLRGCGQLWPHNYWKMLLGLMESGKLSTPWMVT
jgi:threonine dehydrogenase-like Zn-dependent dehydrogenase